jgi:hypothetical protein
LAMARGAKVRYLTKTTFSRIGAAGDGKEEGETAAPAPSAERPRIAVVGKAARKTAVGTKRHRVIGISGWRQEGKAAA